MKWIIFGLGLALVGCTAQPSSKVYVPRKQEVVKNLSCGQKLVQVAWKQNFLWINTRPMHKDDHVDSYSFKEESGLEIKIVECNK